MPAAVRPEHDIRVEQRQQRLEVAAASRGKEGVDDPTLDRDVGVGLWLRRLDPAASPTGELASRAWRTADDRGDLLERDGEHVVEHERESLGRAECLEDDEQRETDRISRDRIRLRRAGRGHDRFRQPRAGVVLAARPPGPQHVEADPTHDGREPWAQVGHVVGRPPVEAQPGFLERVLGLGCRAQHPVRHCAQVGAVTLELLGEVGGAHATNTIR